MTEDLKVTTFADSFAMFDDQQVELLPARTTMKHWGKKGRRHGHGVTNTAVNVAIVYIDGNNNKVEINQFAAAGNTVNK